MKSNFLIVIMVITTFTLIIGCSSDDTPNPDRKVNIEDAVDFSNVLLQAFPLSEVDLNTNQVSIQQPELEKGIPQSKGAIRIELENTDIDKFSLKEVGFNSTEFSISPAVGEKKIILGETIVYTITSTKDDRVSLQYDVLIVEKEAGSVVDFSNALLREFPLSEVDIVLSADKITINQPRLVNGVPQEKGTITIELENTDIDKFSLKDVGFNSEEFSISPAVGEKKITPGETITYTITSTKNATATLQYDVLVVVKDIAPHLQELNITGLSFLKANNPSLSEDINAIEVREHTGQSTYNGTIMIIVPNGTDFSNLIPTLEYEGSSIKYTTEHYGNHANFINYTEGSKLDFKFPNIIAFQIYNSDESSHREYRVLVDVKNPITFDAESTNLGNGSLLLIGLNSYDNVIGFTHNGNYPIQTGLKNSKITLTTTPVINNVDYYLSIRLNEDNQDDDDNIINNGERGKLDLQLNLGTDRHDPTIKHAFEVTFNTMLGSFGTPDVITSGGLSSLNFKVYDPVKVEIVADF